MLLSEIQISQKFGLTLPYLNLVLNIFRELCFKIRQFQASVAYESVTYKRKSV